MRIARERLGQAEARSDGKRELSALAEPEAQVDRSRERWRELRDALTGVGDTEIGVCPTCKRPLEGTLGDLLAEFEEAIASRQREIERISSEMERLVAIGKQHKAAADRAQQLRAQLSSLIDVGGRDHLETAADEAASTARAAAKRHYREHASQRARPELERQASHLLKQVTGSLYPIIRLTPSYLLEVADAGRFHPLKRFSGGEQDLACKFLTTTCQDPT